ncbi:MAG: peptidoglycan DD-metalloendopeptidase family protein [bacterium]
MPINYKKINKFFIIFFITLCFFNVSIFRAKSATIDELKNQIKNINEERDKIQKEIEALDKSILQTQGQAKSLKNELSILVNTMAQLDNQVKITENKIKSAELSIQSLIIDINQKENDISADKKSVSEMLRIINESGNKNSIETILSSTKFSEAWSEIDSLEQLQENVNVRIRGLENKKTTLQINKKEIDIQKKNLDELHSQLLDQKNIASQNKKYKNNLLVQTKNQEANYKKILADRKKKMESMDREMFDYEAELKVAIDPNSFPRAGSRVLSWPVDVPFITQKFGKTADSRRLYASGTHNGVDFRARQGTPLRATADGFVMGTGDTDISCKDASYGRWVLIKHKNGLATLYGHLELIKAKAGQEIHTGDIIGYSGNTGYSEAPHLHFTVFVGNAVRIAGPTEYKSKTCGTYLRLPLAPLNAYLDPQVYLPATGSNLKID